MKNSNNQPGEIFKPFFEPEITKEFSNGIDSNALSIVFDAINSSIGGIIITDRESIIHFANPSFCKMFSYSSSNIMP